MKTIKSILVAVSLILGITATASAQTLEGEWEGTNAAGQFIKLALPGDGTVYFEFNGTASNTLDIEFYPNFTPERLSISYYPTASNTIIRYYTAIYEFININKVNFQYIDGDGTVFPASFTGSFVLDRVVDGMHDPHPPINYTD